MTKVSNAKVRLVVQAFNHMKWEDDFRLRSIEVYERNAYGENKPSVFEINWSSSGSNSVESAIQFAENLRKTASMVQAMNDLEIEKVRTEESTFKNEEEYDKACEEIFNIVKNFETGKLVAWLLK